MTDNDIIKALECCASSEYPDSCADCFYIGCTLKEGCVNEMQRDVLDLINRQKAENERLQKHNTEMAFKHHRDGAKEFAERLKEMCDAPYWCVWLSDIDILLEEMEKETKK